MTTITSTHIDELKTCLKSSTCLSPTCEGYAKEILRWASSAERNAGAVVLVETEEDVSATINFCRKHSIDLVVSGGRHATSGSSSTEGGLVIDLSKMRNAVVDADAKTIKVQGGALWEDVDNAAAEHGLATVGGTVNHTGVGGLTLGGGFGWLSGQYGLTIDNLLETTMVLADGSIVNCSEKENPDLFWAVRGAGQGFGVTTSFTFKLHDQKNPIWGGQILIPIEGNLQTVIDFVNHFSESKVLEAGFFIGIASPPPCGGATFMIAALAYNGTKEQAESFYAPLLNLPLIMNTCGLMPYPEINSMLNPVTTHGGRKAVKGTAIVAPIEVEFVQGIIDSFKSHTTAYPDAINSMILLEFIGPVITQTVSQTATAFANRGSHFNTVVGAMWSDVENDAVCRTWARELAAHIGEKFRCMKPEMGESAPVGEYSNYDGLGSKEGVGSKAKDMFGVNYDRLVQLKAKFDPENLFKRSYDFTS